MHNTIDIDIILKRGVVASVEVEFDKCSHGYAGDYDNPGYADEYEITGLAINNVMCFSKYNPGLPNEREITGLALNNVMRLCGQIATETWYKTGAELIRQGWHDDFVRLAQPLLDEDYYDEWQRMADHELSIQPSPC